jgi:two-component sensor histidine kinase
LQAFALSVLEQGHGWIGEVVCQSRTGRQLEIEVSASELSLSTDHPSCIIALLRDISERKIAEARIKASLAEKDVLLKEIHHRVKNNLQIISSLFDLQSGETKDKTVLEMFRECRNRVRSMAMIHERLYSAQDLGRIDAVQYLSTLTSNLAHSYGLTSRHVQVRLEANEVYLDVDRAIPCGLIVNELVSNALKYAFQSAEDEGSEIVVQLEPKRDDRLQLTMKDNGIGFPAEVDFRNTASLGLRLVNSLVNQLDGEIEMREVDGTCFVILFRVGGTNLPEAEEPGLN